MYIVIAGAGLFGRGLAHRLVEAKHDVVVIDTNRAICEDLTAKTGALSLCGSATNIDILEQAGMARADTAVATMRGDADNLAFSLLARSFDVTKIIARMRNPRYKAAYKMAGVETTVHVIDMMVAQLAIEIADPDLHHVASFGDGKAAVVVDTIKEGSLASGKTVRDIGQDPEFPVECVIGGIIREKNQDFITPRGTAHIQAGDQVFLIGNLDNLRKASKYLHRKQ